MNNKSFIVRLPEETLQQFNEICKEKAINRSELLRLWITEYIAKEQGEKHE